ncbi:hypothetical protein [Streptacidiphilus cavernicola]|uniref:Uncharacterized protein n=1 Tax=Streptacidiphilus cavernicola TaxID=3342716 RepID=A0ABV6W3M6_9ACTN
MIGRVDQEGQDGLPDRPHNDFHDDLLVTLLHPGGELLPAQPGSFDLIRRGATRRRRLRTALGGGLVAVAAVAVALPMLLTGAQTGRTAPVPPLAPNGLSGTGLRHTPAPSASRPPTARPVPEPSSSRLTGPTQVPTPIRTGAGSSTSRGPRSGNPDRPGPTTATPTPTRGVSAPTALPSAASTAAVTGR